VTGGGGPAPGPFIRDDRPVERRYDERRDADRRYGSDDRYRGKQQQRESFLSDLLDF